MKTQKFDAEIYPLAVIQRAVRDYAEIAQIQIFPFKKYTTCVFYDCVASEELTVKEFGNYLIDLIGSAKDTV